MVLTERPEGSSRILAGTLQGLERSLQDPTRSSKIFRDLVKFFTRVAHIYEGNEM